jgi:hypothetical protein
LFIVGYNKFHINLQRKVLVEKYPDRGRANSSVISGESFEIGISFKITI